MRLRLSGNQHLRLERYRVDGDGLVLIARRALHQRSRDVSMVKFGALAMALAVTFTILWALSSYGYPGADARSLPAFAAKAARAAACL